jgi:hypothetical protein
MDLNMVPYFLQAFRLPAAGNASVFFQHPTVHFAYRQIQGVAAVSNTALTVP